MKTRRILYLVAGIFNCIIGGIAMLFGALFLLLSKTIKTMFSQSTEMLQEFAEELAEADSNYEYLLEASQEEILDFVLSVVNKFKLIVIIFAVIFIAFGVFNILLRRMHDRVFTGRKWLKIVFVAASWLILIFNIFNICTTIAVFMKHKDFETKEGLYVSSQET